MLGLRQPSSSSTYDTGRAQGDTGCPEDASQPGAARVLHYGAFFKDYKLTEW